MNKIQKKQDSPVTHAEPEFTIALSREEINAMPIDRYNGPIAVVRDEKDVKQACKELSKEAVLGFDTETRPSFAKAKATILPSYNWRDPRWFICFP